MNYSFGKLGTVSKELEANQEKSEVNKFLSVNFA